MRLTTTLFSCILILLGMMIFHSTDAAKDIFTINNIPPNSNEAFGKAFLEEKDRNGTEGNTFSKPKDLTRPGLMYFGTSSTKIYVSKIFKRFRVQIWNVLISKKLTGKWWRMMSSEIFIQWVQCIYTNSSLSMDEPVKVLRIWKASSMLIQYIMINFGKGKAEKSEFILFSNHRSTSMELFRLMEHQKMA